MEKDNIYISPIENIPSPPPLISESTKKSSRLKNILLTFFLVEHVLILVLLLIPIIFFVRSYASSDFTDLNYKAINFIPSAKDDVIGKYTERYKDYIVEFIKPENTNPVIDIVIEEADLNSFITDLKLDHIKKIYIEPDDQSNLNIWIKPDIIPYPVIVKTNILYNYESKEFKVKFISWAVGPLTFSPDIIRFIEDSINESAWNNIDSTAKSNSLHIIKIETAKGFLHIVFQIDDKVKFTESMLR